MKKKNLIYNCNICNEGLFNNEDEVIEHIIKEHMICEVEFKNEN
jgi:hypothetical protein